MAKLQRIRDTRDSAAVCIYLLFAALRHYSDSATPFRHHGISNVKMHHDVIACSELSEVNHFTPCDNEVIR